MAVKGRVFAGFGAALFLVTSSALTIAVIISLTSTNNSASTTINTVANSKKSSKSSSIDQVGTKLQGFTPLTTPLQHLEVSDIRKGSGVTIKSGATVTASYIGALADSGVIFDTSQAHGGPQTFSLSQVIAGWQLGIPGMKVGGTRELLIPAAMAYGSKGAGSIPPNSDLVFIVTIDGVKNN